MPCAFREGFYIFSIDRSGIACFTNSICFQTKKVDPRAVMTS